MRLMVDCCAARAETAAGPLPLAGKQEESE
jgi:hypothetical protein